MDVGAEPHTPQTSDDLQTWFLGNRSSSGSDEERALRELTRRQRDTRTTSRTARLEFLADRRRINEQNEAQTSSISRRSDDDDVMVSYGYSGPKLAPGEDGQAHFDLIESRLKSMLLPKNKR